MAWAQGCNLLASNPAGTAEFELVTCLSDSICSSLEKHIYGYSRIRVGVPSMRTALLVGGLPIAKQLYRLKSGVQVYTPV